MRPIPTDPLALQARIYDAVFGDIRDKAPGTPRCDALRAVMGAAASPQPALVSDQAASRLAPTGFDQAQGND